MASKTRVANLALARIGVSKSIANVDTDRSQEAVLAREVWDADRDVCLRDVWWPFATQYVSLGLVSDPEVAYNTDWLRAYQYPANCILVRRLLTSNGRRERTPPPFTIARGTIGKLVLTDWQDAVAEITYHVTNTEEYDPAYASMLAWRLAISLAPSLSRVDGIVRTANDAYELERLAAASRAANEGQQDPPREASWIDERL